MASLTSWSRLEPRPRTNLDERTLEARIHDPLWMLARQWQFGELAGEDAGSPIGARLLGSYTMLQRYVPGALPVGDFAQVRPLDPATPLEAQVEREPPQHVPWQAGVQFLRLLGGDLRAKYGQAYRAAFPVTPEVDEVLADHGIDAAALFTSAKAAAVPTFVEPADHAAVQAATARWVSWYEHACGASHGAAAAWQRDRLEYAFAVSSDTAAGEAVLRAAEYYEGHLDWTAFDLDSSGATLRAPKQKPQPVSYEVESVTIPAPVSYKGMPADRWWEFEDGRVNFGHVDAGAADLARMLMIEFAVIYGNDWFVIPVELPVGSLFRARSLVVTDTFGVRTLVPANPAKQQPGQAWRMFELTGSDADSNLFFLPPTLMENLQSEPIEDVVFLRDEMANLAWAVERTVEGPLGKPIDRLAEYRKRREALRELEEASKVLPEEPDRTLLYRLATEVPEPWVPLVPQQIDPVSGQVRLRRGALLLADGSASIATSKGRILAGAELALQEEEVPRAGVRVTRHWEHARWYDGSTHLWIGRRKAIGRGEGSSGLRYDAVDAKP